MPFCVVSMPWDFCDGRSDKSFCVAIVSQPEKGWSSVGGKPDKGTLLANMKARLRELGLANFEGVMLFFVPVDLCLCSS